MTALILELTARGIGVREAISVAQSHVSLALILALWQGEE